MDKIRIASLNARGLKNKLKRTAIFKTLKEQKFDFVCIQEAHIMEKDVSVWEKQWGGKIFYQEGTNHSKGELILVSKHFDGIVTHEKSQDRLIIVSVKQGNMSFYLANAYAPNISNEKIRFFNVLQNVLGEYSQSNLVLTGDFNCVINNEHDIISGNPHNVAEVDQFKDSISTLGLTDIWRVYHTDEKDFTWNRVNPFIARRLDYCFLTDNLLQFCVSSDHLIVPNTDHKAVTLELNESEFKRGPGYWRFNCSHLKDADFVNSMNSLLDNCVQQRYIDNKSATVTWENCKREIKDFCIDYGRMKAQENRNIEKDLQQKLENLEKLLIDNPNCIESQANYNDLKQKLELIHLSKAKGAQIRSRIKWIEDGEKNTKYFLKLEKARGKKKIITRLRKETGEVITHQGEILKEQVNFYSSLYSQTTDSDRDIETEVEEFINNENIPKLDDNEKRSCEGATNLNETSAALKHMSNGTAPGLDGLSIEFMKFFWCKIGSLVTESFNEAFDRGELSYSQKKGVVILLHKGSHLPRDRLANWRPITLTNSDYKILAKVLAQRLGGVIQKLVSLDQVGYISGRNVSTVLRTIDDVIDYVNRTGKSGYLLACDYSKAFDSISKTFLKQTFRSFGFGPDFLKWVDVLFQGSNNCINHGGWLSGSFETLCGIRQGCPFSPLSFVLAVELLAIRIRNSQIKGIKLPTPNQIQQESIKIKQLADDMTLFLNDKLDMVIAKTLIEDFSKFAGLKLNVLKTKAMPLGTQVEDRDLPFETTKMIKILGVYFTRDKMARNIEENWLGRIDKLHSLIKQWNARDLSIHGKVIIVNTFLTSQFNFVMQSVGLPDKILEKINRILYKFIWQRRFSNRKAFEKVKRKVLQQDYGEGGIKMVDMKKMQSYFYLQWAGKLVSKKNENWTFIPNSEIELLKDKFNAFDFNCKFNDLFNTVQVSNSFWKEVLKAYLNNINLNKEITHSNVLNQSLFNNTLVRYRNKMPYNIRWIKKGICKLKDICHLDEKRLLTIEELQAKLETNNARTILEYNVIRNAIPLVWVNWIHNETLTFTEEQEVLKFNTKPKVIKLIIESMNNSDKPKPTACAFWHRKLGVNLDDKIWLIPHQVNKETRLKELQWKINHIIYPTNILLQKMRVTNTNKCSFCVDSIDCIAHFFYECSTVSKLWKQVESKILTRINYKISIDVKKALFGITGDGLSRECFRLVNNMILIAKMSISIAKKTNNICSLMIIFEDALAVRNI